MEDGCPDNTALTVGTSPNYINTHGKPQSIGAETRRRLLDAMHRISAAAQVAATPVPNIMAYTAGKKMPLAVEGNGELSQLLTTGKSVQYKGHAVGDKSFSPPAKLPGGYHTLTLTQGELRSHCRIIAAPKCCCGPQALLAGQKLWGACVQFYTLRSGKNWRTDGFGDLRAVLVDVTQRGDAFIGLNPIHTLYPVNPESASPYSPPLRRWLNAIYIDINTVDDFRLSKEVRARWQEPATQQALQRARNTEWVDYSVITALKVTAPRMAWKNFSTHNDEQIAAFRQLVAQERNSLYWQATFDTLYAHQVRESALCQGWPVWLETLQSVGLLEVKRFREEHRDDADFYLWLQWLACTQFADCWRTNQGFTMPIGLYRDLAVGVVKGGAETQCDRELYCPKVPVDAPSNILGPLGQSWGLPSMDPRIITARAYELFVELPCTNMQSYGTLRIDHVISMLRL